MSKTYSAGRFDSIVDGSITEIESNATSIGQYAFNGCTSLTSAKFPKATSVGNGAFQACNDLTTVDIKLGQGSGSGRINNNAGIFSGSQLRHLIIRSPSVQAVQSTDAISGVVCETPMAGGDGAIYVPDSLVNDYKTGWTGYANIIHPISDYPLEDFSSISDDWETIITNPNYATDYRIGDTKKLEVNGTYTYMQIVAFNADTLASDSTKTANITWIMLPFINLRYQMHTSGTTDGGWESCALRARLRNDILPTMPEVVRNNIKEVTKTYYDYASDSTKTCTDTIWIPSNRELNGALDVASGSTIPVEDSGPIYSEVFSTKMSRIKTGLWSATHHCPWVYWTRTASTATQYCHMIRTNNAVIGEKYYVANSSDPYDVFGFCT